jgi:uroporphyrin-III C-methyltransferase
MSDAPIPIRPAERLAAKHLADALELPVFEPGSVWLAGAGPGDPGLITLLGLHAISEADAILYDALVNVRLLKFARPGAEIVYAGKRRGKASCKQADISRMLVSLARKDRRVLRLKGGDPFVFGRGGEEAEALARARVPFRIVPGVTAGIGGLAYAGIPVTHRDTNHAVTFVTGHGADGKLPDLDWNALAKGAPTLVFYMALAHADEIASRLIAAGRNPQEPAAIVADATSGTQAVQVTTLEGLGREEKSATAPAIIVVGENVRLREGLDWLGALNGERVLSPEPLGRAAMRDVS